MEVTRALATGRRLLREHGLHDWSIVADRAKTRAGVCRFTKRQIGLSAPLTTLHSEDEVLDTILHEIAHALVGPQHGHDAVWRAKAREIGCSGERCVSSDAPRVPGDWVGRCPAGHEKSRHRAPTRLMSCGECSRRFDPRHLFTWSYRGRPAAPADIADDELDRLSARELEVMRLIARGYSYKEVAKELFISIKTVETHVSSVLRKLQLSNRRELTRWATARRLI